MKYLKKYESEGVKLATYLMSDMDKKYNLTSPNDKRELKICQVQYPDGVIINYELIENYYSDVSTITLKIFTLPNNRYSERFQQIYIDMYGDVIQFENFNEYKMIRFYMNIEDIYDVNFSAFLYPPEGVKGFTEVNFKFLDVNYTYGIKNYGPWYNDLYSINLLQYMNTKKMSILKKSNNRLLAQHMFVEILEEINLSNKSYIQEYSIDLDSSKIYLAEYLYYYYTFIYRDDNIKNIFKSGSPIVSNNDLYKTIMKIHY